MGICVSCGACAGQLICAQSKDQPPQSLQKSRTATTRTPDHPPHALNSPSCPSFSDSSSARAAIPRAVSHSAASVTSVSPPSSSPPSSSSWTVPSRPASMIWTASGDLWGWVTGWGLGRLGVVGRGSLHPCTFSGPLAQPNRQQTAPLAPVKGRGHSRAVQHQRPLKLASRAVDGHPRQRIRPRAVQQERVDARPAPDDGAADGDDEGLKLFGVELLTVESSVRE